MAKLPFDPSRARGDQFAGGLFDTKAQERAGSADDASAIESVAEGATPTPKPPRELTVTEFSDLITRTLDDGMRGSFRVQGEISNLSKRGHWYFSIKDAGSVLGCVMWQSDAARSVYDPREGDAVVVTGKVKYYGAQGRTQLYASRIEKQGVGALELRFQQLVAELRALGYFDESRKQPLPEFPRRVAVITSRTGAALQDVLKTAQERCPAVEFVVIDVRVQGPGAAEEVARALRAIEKLHTRLSIDAVILTRGGGSREDLWAFNERVMADAAMALSIPLVAAIGHEVDTSIIELVADQRASTPTQAVMRLLPDLAALDERRARLGRDLRNAMRWALSMKRERLLALASSSALASPALRLAQARAGVHQLEVRRETALTASLARERRVLDQLATRLATHSPVTRAAAARAALAMFGPRLTRAIAVSVGQSRRALVNLERRLRSAGPEETLSRGYAIVTAADGTLVRSIAQARTGERLDVQLTDGLVPVRVEPTPPKE